MKGLVDKCNGKYLMFANQVSLKSDHSSKYKGITLRVISVYCPCTIIVVSTASK